ncbi:MAG: DEAD/DEAH box helicase [Clostridia bacterium]|nr:DEAD/DEAH box helicase [Clostridia bacterium]
MNITDKLISAACSPTIYKRGTEYFKEGRVHLRKREENRITAVVDDENIFSVEVEFDKDGVKNSFCTCPYYQTMKTPCKHIVAALCQRQAEILEGGNYADENDKIASNLCNSFATGEFPKERLNIRFILYINKLVGNVVEYGMSFEVDGVEGQLDGIENFLECYSKGKTFKLGKTLTYTPGVTEFGKAQSKIISILAESYLNRIASTSVYTKAIYRTSFSSNTAQRIFGYLRQCDFTVVLDGMRIPDIMVVDDNPDILIDISATDEDILLAVSDRGLALCDSGEWFMYENTIYHTDDLWRSYFMPIYHALSEDNRMQITFKGNNRLLFAKHVLPKLDGMRGVVMQGLDELIVDTEPQFTIYFDAVKKNISAVIIVKYGSVSIRLPDNTDDEKKVILRDYDKENKILNHFKAFSLSKSTFTLDFDRDIYYFIKNRLGILSEYALIKTSDSFMRLMNTEDITISSGVNYNKTLNLLEADFESNLSANEIYGILEAIRLKNPFYRFADGRFLDFQSDSKAGVFSVLSYLDFSEEDIKNGKKEIDKYYTLYLNSEKSIIRGEGFKEYIEKIQSQKPKIPKGLENVLRDYQKTGLTWLKQLSEFGFGGILADDMGLGKTLQVLAYIHGEKPKTPTLIVAPSSLLYNWLSEINRFVPDAKSIIIDGPKDNRTHLLEDISGYEFVITSYPLLRRDIALYGKYEFEYFFIDEAQNIKNPRTMSANAVKRINARRRFALTGTPIENSLSELWSIFDFIMPGYLKSIYEFRDRFEIPISRDGDSVASTELRAKIKPFIMRRMKSEVLGELPEKIENTIFADLTEHQKDMYSAFLEVAKDETLSLLYEGGQSRMRILTLLMRLRQICCHPRLFDENYRYKSGKLELLMDLVGAGVGGGHRILVFSQFTSMLEIIAEELKKEGITYYYLDGKTKPDERAKMAEEFNDGQREVFLISLKAGGMGLNLVGADMVIHYDPWWNPAVTEQASDRAYRIGQKRAVQVIRLAAKGTIEEKILDLQNNKRNLADDIITANNKTLKSLSNEEIMSLFEEE